MEGVPLTLKYWIRPILLYGMCVLITVQFHNPYTPQICSYINSICASARQVVNCWALNACLPSPDSCVLVSCAFFLEFLY